MSTACPAHLRQLLGSRLHAFRARLVRWAKPTTGALLPGAAADLARTKAELVAENALLWQQLIVLRRTVRCPCPGYFPRPRLSYCHMAP